MKIYENLGVAIRQKTVKVVSVLDALEVNKYLDEFIKRKSGNVGLVDHRRVLDGIISLFHGRDK